MRPPAHGMDGVKAAACPKRVCLSPYLPASDSDADVLTSDCACSSITAPSWIYLACLIRTSSASKSATKIRSDATDDGRGRVEQRGCVVVRPLSGPFSETSFLLINSYLSRSSETRRAWWPYEETPTGRPWPPRRPISWFM